MERKKAEQLVARFRGVRVGILGDLMLDVFIRGRVSRISPEAPVPVVEMESEEFCLGGAGNVAHNLAALGGVPSLVAVVGEDPGGDRLRALLESFGLSTDGIVRDSTRPTTVKSRIIAHSQQMIRVDRESRDGVPQRVERELVRRLRSSLPGLRAVLVSDYAKGVVTRRTVDAARKARSIPLFVDPKVPHSALYRGATIVTPNLREAESLSGVRIVDERSLERAGRAIMKSLHCPQLLITRGEEGMSLFEPARITRIPARSREVFDVTGAGDTVIATLALARGAGASWLDAATLANHAAGIVVSKLGTEVVTARELVESFAD